MAAKKSANRPGASVPAGWSEVERPDIITWDKGMSVTGRFVEVRPAGKGKVLDMMVDGKYSTYGCPTVLDSMLRGFERGNPLHIECLGKTVSTPNGMAWGFKVYRPGKADQADLPF